MPAILDPDELAHMQTQLGSDQLSAAPGMPAVAAGQPGPIIDEDELAHARSQLATPEVAEPAADVVGKTPYAGQEMRARPDRKWYEPIGDVGRMLTSKIPFSDRFAAGMDTLVPGTGPGKSRSYEDNLRDERVQNEAVAHDYPILSKVLGLGGSAAAVLATAPEQAVVAPTMALRTAWGAGTGAGYGALQGASDTPDLSNSSEAIRNIASGAATGAATGLALPAVAKGLGAAYEGAANVVGGAADGISRGATKQLLPALAADTPQAVEANLARLGDQGMLADTGPAMLGKAQGASLNSDEGRSVLNNALGNRSKQTNARIGADVNSALGPAEDPQLVTNAILSHRSAVDAENYGAALSGAPPVDTGGVTATVGQMISDSLPGSMEHKALTNARQMLMDSREVPVLDAGGRPVIDAQGNPLTRTQPIPRTNASQLHKLKGELDNVIHYDAPGLGVPAGALQRQQGTLKVIRGQLNSALEEQVPGYASANATSAGLAKRAEAVKIGTSVLDSGKTAMTPENLSQQFSAMLPGEQIALAKGTRGEIGRVLATRPNDLVAGKNVIKGEGDWNRDRLATVFGDQPTNAVIDAVDREGQFANTFNKVVENSQTAQRNAAAAAMKPGASTGGIPYINPNVTMTGLALTPVKKMANALLGQFQSDPTRSYGEVARVLSAQGPQRDAYYSALADALMRRSANAGRGETFGNRSALAAALIGAPALNDRMLGR